MEYPGDDDIVYGAHMLTCIDFRSIRSGHLPFLAAYLKTIEESPTVPTPAPQAILPHRPLEMPKHGPDEVTLLISPEPESQLFPDR